jgi:hypothetical protein
MVSIIHLEFKIFLEIIIVQFIKLWGLRKKQI